MNFQPGEVVQLNSGGPKMSVSFVGEKQFSHGKKTLVVQCTWFEGVNLEKHEFLPEQLRKVEK